MSSTSRSILLENNKRRVREIFRLLDADADGYLDYYETKAALKAMGLTVKKSFVISIIRIYNKCSDKISFDDFNYVALEKLSKQCPMDQAKYAFKLFSNESINSNITVKDLKRINEKLDCNLTLEEMELMIQEFDLDKDGSINESEFLEIMTGSEI